MIVRVGYFGYCRMDGSINEVIFDTEKKTYWNGPSENGYGKIDANIGTEKSLDVNEMRRVLVLEGYEEKG